jgi:hypothetical protein
MKLKVFAMCFPCSLLHNFPAASMASLAPPAPPLLAPLSPLYVETTHPDTNTAKASLQEHAKASGFAISVDSSSARRMFYICSKGGKYSNQGKDPTVHESQQRKNTVSRPDMSRLTVSGDIITGYGRSSCSWQ